MEDGERYVGSPDAAVLGRAHDALRGAGGRPAPGAPRARVPLRAGEPAPCVLGPGAKPTDPQVRARGAGLVPGFLAARPGPRPTPAHPP
jgi:hypothetical protein